MKYSSKTSPVNRYILDPRIRSSHNICCPLRDSLSPKISYSIESQAPLYDLVSFIMRKWWVSLSLSLQSYPLDTSITNHQQNNLQFSIQPTKNKNKICDGLHCITTYPSQTNHSICFDNRNSSSRYYWSVRVLLTYRSLRLHRGYCFSLLRLKHADYEPQRYKLLQLLQLLRLRRLSKFLSGRL